MNSASRSQIRPRVGNTVRRVGTDTPDGTVLALFHDTTRAQVSWYLGDEAGSGVPRISHTRVTS